MGGLCNEGFRSRPDFVVCQVIQSLCEGFLGSL